MLWILHLMMFNCRQYSKLSVTSLVNLVLTVLNIQRCLLWPGGSRQNYWHRQSYCAIFSILSMSYRKFRKAFNIPLQSSASSMKRSHREIVLHHSLACSCGKHTVNRCFWMAISSVTQLSAAAHRGAQWVQFAVTCLAQRHFNKLLISARNCAHHAVMTT